MKELADSELRDIGRQAAMQVAGLGTVDDVVVTTGQDWTERPAYFFSFLVDRDRDNPRFGLAYSRLIQKLRDELLARDDLHFPMVEIFDQKDWNRRGRS